MRLIHTHWKAKALAPFTVGYVVEAVKHPNADKLRVCKVDTGNGIVQVVCGAPNARTGMKGVFAPPGTHIPGTGLDLKAGNIRGEASNGMLCSARELGLGQDHDQRRAGWIVPVTGFQGGPIRLAPVDVGMDDGCHRLAAEEAVGAQGRMPAADVGEPGGERPLGRGEGVQVRRRPCRAEVERAAVYERERRWRKGHDDFD